MSRMIEIAAEAERPEFGADAGFPRRARHLDETPSAEYPHFSGRPASGTPVSCEGGRGHAGNT
jgi:hypothetical protein